MIAAIAREKQIKAGSRKKKLALIESMNPGWLDLFETLFYKSASLLRNLWVASSLRSSQ